MDNARDDMALKHNIKDKIECPDNPNFNCIEFDTIRNAADSNYFVLSVKSWI